MEPSVTFDSTFEEAPPITVDDKDNSLEKKVVQFYEEPPAPTPAPAPASAPASAPTEEPMGLDSSVDERFGYCSFKPKCLQSLNKIRVFVVASVFQCFFEGFAVNGIVNTARPHLEKQFHMTSSRSALITSAQDIGALSVILLVSYIGSNKRYNKALCVAIGSVLLSLGSLIFVIPHILVIASIEEKETASSEVHRLCIDKNSSVSRLDIPDKLENVWYTGTDFILCLFMLGNLFHGMGFCPSFVVGTVYIDENEQPSVAAVYVGLIYAALALGVAFGFLSGGQFLEHFYVDFDRVDQNSLNFGPGDKEKWIGAWWMGFIPAIVAFVLVAIPLFGFPKQLPGRPSAVQSTIEMERISSVAFKRRGSRRMSNIETVSSFICSIGKLVCDPSFMFLSLGATAEGLAMSGFGSFSFKYIMLQYDLKNDYAGALMGCLVLCSAGGMIMGGVVIRLFKLEAVGMTRLSACVSAIATVVGFALMAGCPDVNLVGLESNSNTSPNNGPMSPCQKSCDCRSVPFDPVCLPGSASQVYYSPCHAGCRKVVNSSDPVKYTNCSCTDDTAGSDKGSATKGRCSVGCWSLYLGAPALCVSLFLVLSTTTLTSMATLRVVPPALKSFALGIQWTMFRLFGVFFSTSSGSNTKPSAGWRRTGRDMLSLADYI